ncbi:hypothetical protein [Dokdonia sp.]|uniref:hypothetical protein n=1 Tax=Dokdonia sp. TaxID=2024995 RepID=UPI0032659179
MTELVVKDIVGISVNQETKTAIVRFSYITETTPFQKIRFSKRRGCEITQGEEEVTFVLYDTGWKIQTETQSK